MYIAMNRFTVPAENAEAFEAIWLGRESFLNGMDGFMAFNMLKGPEVDGSILYASHTTWETEDAFRAWTRSEAFRNAHKDAGSTAKLHSGSPQFEGFSTIQTITAGAD